MKPMTAVVGMVFAMGLIIVGLMLAHIQAGTFGFKHDGAWVLFSIIIFVPIIRKNISW